MNIEQIIVDHVAWIHIKARRYYTDEFEADNLASETIYKCLSQSKRFDTTRGFKPWALAIMENTYITQYNRRRCVMFTGLDGHDPDSGPECADQRVMLHNIFSIIRKCARQSCCIDCVLLYARGFSYSEIADIVGVPVGTVKSRVAAGRKMLSEALR